MKHSVFLSRTPIVNASDFVGREESLNWISDKLSRQIPQNCNVVGEPRIGKTSLLYRAYQERAGLPAGVRGLYVWLPLAELPAVNSAAFWRALVERLNETAGRYKVEIQLPSSDTLQRFEADEIFDFLYAGVEHLFAQGEIQRLVLFIDDFDLFVPGLAQQDFDWLRSLVMSFAARFAFVISTRTPLIRLIPDSSVSPFANVFENRHVRLLAREAAEALIRKAAEAEQMPPPGAQAVQFLLREVGKHPDLLKLACAYLFKELELKGCANRDDLYDDVRSDLRYDGHVRWLFSQLVDPERRREEERRVLFALAAGSPVEDRIVLRHLERKLGLVEKRNGRPLLFCEAFRDYLRTHRPGEMDGDAAVEGSDGETPEFEYIPGQRLVHVAGDTRKLTKLENRLLAYLIDHPNEVCTTQQLLDGVWGAGRSESVVEKAVNRLRKKVEEDPGRPRRIVSARGEGYMLRLE